MFFGLTTKNRGAMHGEQNHLSDVSGSTKKHCKSIDATAPASCRRHPILKRLNKVLVISMQLFIYIFVVLCKFINAPVIYGRHPILKRINVVLIYSFALFFIFYGLTLDELRLHLESSCLLCRTVLLWVCIDYLHTVNEKLESLSQVLRSSVSMRSPLSLTLG